MFLHRLHLDLRCTQVRRDLADPYQMHSTLCRAFFPPEVKCQPGAFLWRLEPEQHPYGFAKVMVQSRDLPDWSRISIRNWLGEEPSPHIDMSKKLNHNSLRCGGHARYRLRANPSICRKGKRFGLLEAESQEEWLRRQGKASGFNPITIHRSEERMLRGADRNGHSISLFSVLYDGVLEISDASAFVRSIDCGVGRGKGMGLGLLSIVPLEKPDAS